MTEKSYTISIENAYETIDFLKQSLSSRLPKIKQSDVKEAISTMLGFDTSNELDAKIKTHKERQRTQDFFDKQGRHKKTSNISLKTKKNPLKLHKFLKNNKKLTTAIEFNYDFEVTGGHQFKCGDVLLTNDKYSALKMALNWDQIAKIEFKNYKDMNFFDDESEDEISEYRKLKGGVWEIYFSNHGNSHCFGDNGCLYITSPFDNQNPINSPNTPIEEVTRYFINEVIKEDLPVSLSDRESFESYIYHLVVDQYRETKPTTEKEFIKHVEKFLPHIGIEEIVNVEVGQSPTSYLEILMAYGARFDKTYLLDHAIYAGDVECCEFLFSKGNILEKIYTDCKYESIDESYFYSHSDYGDKPEEAIRYYMTAKKIGASLHLKNKEGCSVIDLAAKHGNDELYKFLVSSF
jgi:hypothetical protein